MQNNMSPQEHSLLYRLEQEIIYLRTQIKDFTEKQEHKFQEYTRQSENQIQFRNMQDSLDRLEDDVKELRKELGTQDDEARARDKETRELLNNAKFSGVALVATTLLTGLIIALIGLVFNFLGGK